MKIDQAKLIANLRAQTQEAISAVSEFKSYPHAELNYKSSPKTWSILECFEHLNRYGKFYLPELEKQIMNAPQIQGNRHFKSGIIGEYFVNAIKPTNTKKMKSPKPMDSTGSDLNSAVIDQFLKQLNQLDFLLEEAGKVDLMKVKTAISLTKLIKLRLGDTLRFMVYHNERHILQAKRIEIQTSSYR